MFELSPLCMFVSGELYGSFLSKANPNPATSVWVIPTIGTHQPLCIVLSKYIPPFCLKN